MTPKQLLSVSVLLLAGCQTLPKVPSTPPPAIYQIQGRPVVCLSEPHEGLEQWRAMCAPMGQWMPCIETEETLQCKGAAMAGFQ